MTPILLIGAGRMGGAMLQGWRRAGVVADRDCLLRVRSVTPAALAAGEGGATIDPPDEALRAARTVILGVKPQVWRQVAADYQALLSPDAIIVSVLVGVKLEAIAEAFGGRRVVRVMPTTGVAIARGVASIYAADADSRARGHALFDPVATTVDILDEGLMDAASAVSGSGPAYIYAFVEALEAAGVGADLPPDVARTLARATLVSAAAYLAETGEEPSDLRRQVASPGGTTQAALAVLAGDAGLAPLLQAAVRANVARARELAG